MNPLRRRRIRRQLALIFEYAGRLGEPVEVAAGSQQRPALTGSPGLHVESVACPFCGAEAGRSCIRPLVKADRRGQSHRERWAAYHRMKLAA